MSDTGVNDTIDGDVARYATAVRAAFADLPGPERELLLEDLEDHLLEVAAEAGGPLEERLGRPAAYAAELRASAGLPAAGAAAAGRARPRLRESRVARRLRRSWRGTMAHPAAAATAEFLPELRPAWWVLRGYVAVLAASAVLGGLYPGDGQGMRFPVPALLGSQLLGLLASWPRWSCRCGWADGARPPGGGAAWPWPATPPSACSPCSCWSTWERE